jgi:phage shock protein E
MKILILIVLIIIIAVIILNLLKGKSIDKVFSLPADSLYIIDVRSKQEFDSGHFSTAVNIPHDQIANRIKEIEPFKQKKIVVYCASGNRSAMAMNILKQKGFADVVNAGGYSSIQKFDKK